jgi:hypothetical protein
MDGSDLSTAGWASSEFGHCDLGDFRRTRRLVRVASAVADNPAGKVTEVFATSAGRQGAYDLLANTAVTEQRLLDSVARATLARCEGEEFVFVSVDGSAITLTDRAGTKGFGGIGSTEQGNRGIKVVHAYAIAPSGVPLGILDQRYWARVPLKKRWNSRSRPLEDKETKHWIDSIQASGERLRDAGLKPWFLLDREADGYWKLRTLDESGHWFTVRSTWPNRFARDERKRKSRLQTILSKTRVQYTYTVDVPASGKRRPRRATLSVRAAPMELLLMDRPTHDTRWLPIHVVEAREVRTTPRGEKPIYWRLLTNRPISTPKEVAQVLASYLHRWPIEELHKSWKSGVCRVEDAQLRSMDRMVKWLIVTATVAARIERLKVRSRTEPKSDATLEFTPWELEALYVMKRKEAGRMKARIRRPKTLERAVAWVAEFGGYTGASSGGPPGAITIRRGLERIAPIALALEELHASGRLR